MQTALPATHGRHLMEALTPAHQHGSDARTPGGKLREIFGALRRRGKLIALILVTLNAITIATVLSLEPRYTAEASLIIGSRQAQVLDLKNVIAGLTGDSEEIESEIHLLRSRALARGVVQKLHLDEYAEFNPALSGPGFLGSAFAYVMAALQPARDAFSWLSSLLPGKAGRQAALIGSLGKPAAEGDARDPLALPIDNFLTHLVITPKGRSRVIGVAFTSVDPGIAAAAANAVADAYIDGQLRVKIDATEHAHKWLNERVAEMREKVIVADEAVEAFRTKVGITQGRTGVPLLSEQMSDVSNQIIRASAARAAAEARQQAAGDSDIADAQASLTVQALRKQEGLLGQRATELAASFGESYPPVLAARAAVRDVQARIRAEVNRVTDGLRHEVEIARANETKLRDQLRFLQTEISSGNENEVELRVLQHEADAHRALYDRLLARATETNVEGGLQQPDSQIVSHAEQPARSSFPTPSILLPICFLASCIIAVLLVLAVESLDHGFSGPEQVEQMLGISALGVVPLLKRGRGNRRPPEAYVLDHPASPFGEAIRSLHTSLMLSDVAQPPKVVLIASALPGEGKSTIALSLARLMAMHGKRVILIDCDLRRPALHKAFGGTHSPGLVECLSGQAKLLDVVQRDTQSRARLIAAGSTADTSPDLFTSVQMRKLISALSTHFDLVILDSAPVLALSDTRNLCRLADKTVFVVRWQDTRRCAAMPALRHMIEAGGDIVGILLSMVDLNRYASHSHHGFYQRRLSLYLGG